MKSPLTRVHAAIVEACPDVMWRICKVCKHKHGKEAVGYCGYNGCEAFLDHQCERGERELRLADVLRAIGSDDYGIDSRGYFLVRAGKGKGDHEGIGLHPEWNDAGSKEIHRWELKNDSLDAQSPETISFLESILCK